MSEIVIVGGTGYTGANVAREARGRGHSVVVISRRAPGDPVEGVRYLQGQAADAAHLIERADVLVGALSPRGETAGTLRAVYASLAARAQEIDARLVVVGGFGSLRPADGAPRFADSGAMPPEYAAESSEMNQVRADLAQTTGTDWLYVSPAAEYGSFAPGERLGRYRVGGEVALHDADGRSAISGTDFAAAVLDEIETPAHRREHIHVVY